MTGTFPFTGTLGRTRSLLPDEVPENVIAQAKIFHFGSLSLTGEPVRSATQKAVALAQAADCIIFFLIQTCAHLCGIVLEPGKRTDPLGPCTV